MMFRKRSEAVKAMAPYYHTGKPCVNGHHAKRSTVDGRCVECAKQYSRAQGEKLKELRVKIREANKPIELDTPI